MTDLSGLSDAQLLQLANSGGSPTAAPPPMPVQVTSQPPVLGAQPAPQYNQGFNPATATDAQLQAYAADNNPHMSSPEDFGRSVMGGLDRGIAGLGTTIQGVNDLGHQIAQAGVSFMGRHGVGDGKLHIPEHGVGNMPTMQDYLQLLGNAAGQKAGVDPASVQAGVGMTMPGAGMSSMAPSGEQLAVGLNGGVPIHKPQTVAGDYAQRIAEFAPMLGTPGKATTRLARMLVPGGGSQAMQDAAPENLKSQAATLGAALGGGLVEGGVAVANAPHRLIGQAMSELSPEQVQAAQVAQQSAASLPGGGIHITPPEASGSKAMLALQHFAENSPAGRKFTDPVFAKRPGQVSSTVNALADAISPPDTAPSASAIKNQAGAQGVLDAARQDVNAQAQPHYDALPGQVTPPNPAEVAPQARYAGTPIPTEQYAPLAKNQAYQIALGQVRGDKLLNAGIAHLPDTDLGVVNEVVKQLDRNQMAEQQTAMNPGGSNYKASLYGAARKVADDLGASVSPNWRAARDIVAQGHEQVLDPMAGGPVGRIAKSDTIPRQVGAMFPAQPVEGSAGETGAAAAQLPRDVTANLTRHHLIDAFNTANTDNVTGPNEFAGAKLAKALVGHDERAAALQNTLQAMDPSGTLGGHSDDLMAALQATGRRQQTGSQTSFNNELGAQIRSSPAPIRVLGAIADPLEWGKNIDHAIGGKLYQSKVKLIADMLSASPQDAAAIMAKAQKANSSILPQLLMDSRETRH